MSAIVSFPKRVGFPVATPKLRYRRLDADNEVFPPAADY
jgi:hypothetical protein